MSTAAVNHSSQTPNDAHNDHHAAGTPEASVASATCARGEGGEGGDSLDTKYPPQKHAGKAGLGPHYYEQHRATFQDKVHGLREELQGEIKHDTELRQKGHQRITGELKEKEREEKEKTSPFHQSENKDQKTTDKPAGNT